MVDISSFRRDANAMAHGEWVSPGPEFGDIEIRTKAISYSYIDAKAAAMRQAAREFGGIDKIPSEREARINVECMINHALLDVRGLTAGGEPVGFRAFCDMLRNPEFGELASMAFTACNLVGRLRAADMDAGAGNSVAPSAGS